LRSPLVIRLGALKQGENSLGFEFPPGDLGFSPREVAENPSFEHFVGPVRVKVKVVRSGQRLMVTGSVGFRARLECALCREEFETDFEEPLTAEFLSYEPGTAEQKELDAREADRMRLSTDYRDLAPLVRDAIHLAVPIAPACRPDCKGLCAVCGADLNQGPCLCTTGAGARKG
jgi:uncharacterized protein